jgi:hypothetical protein
MSKTGRLVRLHDTPPDAVWSRPRPQGPDADRGARIDPRRPRCQAVLRSRLAVSQGVCGRKHQAAIAAQYVEGRISPPMHVAIGGACAG